MLGSWRAFLDLRRPLQAVDGEAIRPVARKIRAPSPQPRHLSPGELPSDAVAA